MGKAGLSDGSVTARTDNRFDYTRCPVCGYEIRDGHDQSLHQVAAIERIAAALESLALASAAFPKAAA